MFRSLHWGRRGTTSRELEWAPTAKAKRAHLFPAPWSVVSLGSLKQALAGVFMPQKLANQTDQVLFLFLERAGCQALASTALASAHPGPPGHKTAECQPRPSPSPPAPAAPPRCLRALLLRGARCKPESKRTTAGHGQTACCLLRAPGCPAAPGHAAARNTSYRPATWGLQPMSRHVFPTRDNPKSREVGGG